MGDSLDGWCQRPLQPDQQRGGHLGNNNLLSGSSVLIGSTTGSKVYGYVNGINVTSNGATSFTQPSGAGANSHTVSTLSIPFSVTSFGTTTYIPSTASSVSALNQTGAAVLFDVDASGTIKTAAQIGAEAGTITFTGGTVGSTLIPNGSGNYAIPSGQTANFVLNVLVSPTTLGTSSLRAALVNVPWSTLSTASSYTADNTTGYDSYTAGLNANAFKTPYVALQ